jgi:hypothetical protein
VLPVMLRLLLPARPGDSSEAGEGGQET